jgi:hypothetical protein
MRLEGAPMRQLLVVVTFFLVATFGKVSSAAAADFVVTSGGQGAYLVNGQPNPTLTLTRGRSYTFDVTPSAVGHPFWIKTVQETGTDNSYDTGVTNNGIAPGLLTFAVPSDAPAELFYQCQYHEPMAGRLVLVSAAAPTVPSSTWLIGLALGLALLVLGAWASKQRHRSLSRHVG